MIPRKVRGPQDQFERSGAQSLRDIRPFTVRLSEMLHSSASALILGMAAVGTYLEPAVVDVAVPLSIAYAAWVLTRRVALPMRLPRSAGLPDYSDPTPGSRKPKMASADHFIGWSISGQELWITAEDARQHITIPGTTGAGKTSAIISLLCSSLAQGSGFVLVDGKADRTLFGKVLALARRFGRDDDVRVLNFMVASGHQESHSFNPFATGNANAVRELLVSQLGEQAEHDPNGVFRDRAVALLGTIAPVLVWLRDNKGISLNADIIRFSIELPWIWHMATRKVCQLRDPDTGEETEIDVANEIPELLVWPLKAYLGELPNLDRTIPLEGQNTFEAKRQHGFSQGYYTGIFTQLTVALGHIFRCESGDIDMRDIVLNRRILVVNLPALENSDPTLAGLGKLVIATLRDMMAQLLGGSLEGTYTEADKPGMGPSPFPVVLDEVAYYATSGLDRMLAMGRGLNISFILGFQEVSGIWARLNEKTASLLGNANITIAMRQQDAGRTREWLEKTAGQTNVTQAISYQGASDGAYREANQAEMRTVSRVDWNDLTSLIEGEAIILVGGRRIYARVFHAQIDDAGPKRPGRNLMLPIPDEALLHARLARATQIAANITRGSVLAGGNEDISPGLKALLDGFARPAGAADSTQQRFETALAEIGKLPAEKLPARPAPPVDGTPVIAVTHMLVAASEMVFTGPKAAGLPDEPVDARLLRSITAIEKTAGVPDALLRGAALSILREREEVVAATQVPQPRVMTIEELERRIKNIIFALTAIGLPAASSRAA